MKVTNMPQLFRASICPAASPQLKDMQAKQIQAYDSVLAASRQFWYFSYGINYEHLAKVSQTAKLSRVRRPTLTISNVDTQQGNFPGTGNELGSYYLRSYAINNKGNANPVHANGANFLFVDGHVEWDKLPGKYWAPELVPNVHGVPAGFNQDWYWQLNK